MDSYLQATPPRARRVVERRAAGQPHVRRNLIRERRASESLEESVVVAVIADPETDPCVILSDGKSSMVQGYASRVDGSARVDLLEAQTWVGGVLLEKSESLLCSLLNFGREGREGLSKGAVVREVTASWGGGAS